MLQNKSNRANYCYLSECELAIYNLGYIATESTDDRYGYNIIIGFLQSFILSLSAN